MIAAIWSPLCFNSAEHLLFILSRIFSLIVLLNGCVPPSEGRHHLSRNFVCLFHCYVPLPSTSQVLKQNVLSELIIE